MDSVQAALDQVGDRWTFLVLREAYFGVRRFVDFQRNLGIARNLLSGRLEQLVANRLLERHRYQERPERFEYRLTAKGLDLFDAIVALLRWGDRWLFDQPPLVLSHAADGGAVVQQTTCAACGRRLTATDVHYEPSPANPSDRR